jgi:hypothetical protein
MRRCAATRAHRKGRMVTALTSPGRGHHLDPDSEHPGLPVSVSSLAFVLLKVVPTVRLRVIRAAGTQQLCPTNPRVPPRVSPSALVQCPAARGFVVGAVAGIPRWHARGQGFKSPQLHQAQRNGSTPAQGRLSADCQQITSRDLINTLSVGRFRPLQASRGSPVVVLGRLQPRTWTAEDGSARSTVELIAEDRAKPALSNRPTRAGHHKRQPSGAPRLRRPAHAAESPPPPNIV